MKTTPVNFGCRPDRQHGMTLVEMMVAMAIGSIVLAVIAGLTVYGARSFIVLGNYSTLDQQSRLGVDRMVREIRQATGVVNWQTNGSSRWILFTNSTGPYSVKYTWDSSSKKLQSQKTGESAKDVLTGCDDWKFSFWQRTPQSNQANIFFPATTPTLCKLVDMTWKCSRSVYGTNMVNTETIQTAQVVLRNQRSK